MSSVLVIGDIADGATSPQTLELLSAARSIAGDGDRITLALAGAGSLATPNVVCDTVYLLEHDALGDADSATFDAASDALTAVAREISPRAILFGRSDAASVIAPRVAMRLGASFSRDCTALSSDGADIVVTRPVYGGNANARFRLKADGIHVIMLRPGSHEPVAVHGATPEAVRFDPAPHIRNSRSTLIRTVQEAQEGVRLEDADVVVSGGRGLGGPEPFEQVAELAGLLGGAVGASRAACDAGWIDHSHQVGLTGKSVSPRLYIAVGISGASQHMAGCSSARNIVAINTDADASIFGDAKFGVVGDWSKVLPGLIAAIRDLG